jgi:hypothetical protein
MSNRPGMALAIAIFAIVIIGVMVTGAFFAATQEFRIGTNTLVQTRSLSAAEYGLSEAMASWSAAQSSIPVGQMSSVAYHDGNGATATVNVTRLNQASFSVISEGRTGNGVNDAARRHIAMMVKLRLPQMSFLGALTVRGSTKLGGSSFIDGTDHNPAGWDCPPLGSTMPAVAINDATKITYSGCNNGSCLNGDPDIQETPLAGDDETYFEYGDVAWAELIASANKVYAAGEVKTGIAPVVLNGVCHTASATNWGDPDRTGPCGTYFPVIYAKGNLHLNGGRGQGILLVEGDLEVNGGFQFFGPVIARGHLKTTGTGGHFNGGVMAANVDLEQNTVLGNAVVNFSRCAINQALVNSAVPEKMMERAWVEMF